MFGLCSSQELRLGDFAYYGWRWLASPSVPGAGSHEGIRSFSCFWPARPGPGCLPLLASARLEDFQNEAEGAQPVDLAEPLG